MSNNYFNLVKAYLRDNATQVCSTTFENRERFCPRFSVDFNKSNTFPIIFAKKKVIEL